MEERIRELVNLLNKASKVYYSQKDEIMSNVEYDALYAELEELEKISGVIFPDSPTQNIGYRVVSKLPKEKHEIPALSLDKFQEKNDGKQKLLEWLGDYEGVLMPKCDGLTLVVTYDSSDLDDAEPDFDVENATLKKAVTRGNGYIGEVVTHNAKYIKGLPGKIPYKGKFIIRGEVIITYSDFVKINEKLPECEGPYSNPRNLAAGSVRALSSEIAAKRHLRFKCFEVAEFDSDELNELSFEQQLKFISDCGIDTVSYIKVDKSNLLTQVDEFEEKLKKSNIPTDGLVLRYNDTKYARTLGFTGKYPRYAKALKWSDEVYKTHIRKIDWSATRTGKIVPTAVFDPVDIDGSRVSRASVHNLGILERLKLGANDEISVARSNMVIPIIVENFTKSNNFSIPPYCPVCGAPTDIEVSATTKTLRCNNPYCGAKRINFFEHFCQRDCMNIEGLSATTLQKFIDAGFISKVSDIYNLWMHTNELIEMEGFGQKSYDNLMEAIENSREVVLDHFINALGIPNVGKDTAKIIARHCITYDNFKKMVINKESFVSCDGIGAVIDKSIKQWYFNGAIDLLEALEAELVILDMPKTQDEIFTGMVIVITGSLIHFKNRDSLKIKIEENGGKVSESVSKKTSLLINNDFTSTSGKNKSAIKYGIPIMSEETFLETYNLNW